MNMGTPDWKPWIFDEKQSEPIVAHALANGVNFIDLADFYSAVSARKWWGASSSALRAVKTSWSPPRSAMAPAAASTPAAIHANTSWTASMRP
ncbi:hypothetical protein DdX_22063 [Ditylenchus destructor]|uniref:NADP-dependent oxidoreductase domain-containing protein n=1 Tax=Ditylenchus destructor TaxID=166010 RepID=A0AAD4MEK6_9BILA|nr:hypothetical protein DdX_22063 [Ditylenchus destructor]